MVKFSTHWKSSSKPGKQRKYRYNAPLHIRQKLVHVHLSKALHEKFGVRSAQIKVGDKVKVMRGSFAPREAKVERVDLHRTRVYVVGCERAKKDGNKVKVPIHPSNLLAVDLDMSDKRRVASVTKAKSESTKVGAKGVVVKSAVSKSSTSVESKSTESKTTKVRGSTK